MKIDILREADFDWLLEKDMEIYPTDKPVTREIIEKWYLYHPEFGIVFRDGNEIEGMNITIPLNRKGWEGLINGELLESDCDDRFAFNNKEDTEIGLHIYHIRKTGDTKGFYKDSLIALNHILDNLRKDNDNLKVIGFSGLCVTKMGIGLFFNKLDCRERAFIVSEHIIKKDNKLKIFEIDSQEELNQKLIEGYIYLNRCKMLLTYPNNPGLIWRYIKAG
jgi:hypothetical protein